MAHVADDGTVTVYHRVVRVDRSPMNPKIRVAQLECGHDVFSTPPVRAPKVGVLRSCEKCSRAKKAEGR